MSVLFIIVPIFIAVVFIFMIAMMVSPKLRGKMMSRQIKAQKYMMDESREDLKSITDGMAYASKDGVKTIAGAIKEGFNSEGGFKKDSKFCKMCGYPIDADSNFCKKCGKEQ